MYKVVQLVDALFWPILHYPARPTIYTFQLVPTTYQCLGEKVRNISHGMKPHIPGSILTAFIPKAYRMITAIVSRCYCSETKSKSIGNKSRTSQ